MANRLALAAKLLLQTITKELTLQCLQRCSTPRVREIRSLCLWIFVYIFITLVFMTVPRHQHLGAFICNCKV